jgi:membrane-bound metal-dependent hydrolase YbcI (DUF457 family)
MTGKTHKIIGLTVGVGYFLSQNQLNYAPATLAAVAFLSYFGALLPDIDQPAAELWGELPFGHTLGKISDPFLKHRNITHSLAGLIGIGLLVHYMLSLMPSYWGINPHFAFVAFLLGFASHLLADMLTVEGIPLFLPCKKMLGLPPRPFEGIRIETGKWFENLVIFPIVNLVLIIIIWTDWTKIKQIILK